MQMREPALRIECPTCEGLGCVDGEHDGKPARVTCPQCKGNEFVRIAAPDTLAKIIADLRWYSNIGIISQLIIRLEAFAVANDATLIDDHQKRPNT